jgi:hypothetical protein
MATIGQADEINSATDDPPSLLHAQEQGAPPSDTRATEPQWPHTPMLEPLLALPEPSIELFLGQVVERSHVCGLETGFHPVDLSIRTRFQWEIYYHECNGPKSQCGSGRV